MTREEVIKELDFITKATDDYIEDEAISFIEEYCEYKKIINNYFIKAEDGMLKVKINRDNIIISR